MKPAEFVAKWSSEAERLGRLRAAVDGAVLVHEVLSDFAAVMRADVEEALTLPEAARESGYSADHLGRLVRNGRIPNAGRPKAPRIFRRDLPRKASGLRSDRATVSLLGATPGQIARAVVTSSQGDGR